MAVQVVAAALAALAAAAQSPPPIGSDDKEVIILPAEYVEPIKAALTAFRQSHSNWECFNVVVSPQDDALQIGFTSTFLTSKDPKTGHVTIGPQTKCGKGATYLVRRDGAILRRLP